MSVEKGLCVDRGCTQGSRHAAVARQLAQDNEDVVRQTPCLVQRQGLS